jgi:hypothetical protein
MSNATRTKKAPDYDHDKIDMRQYFRGIGHPPIVAGDNSEWSEKGWARTPIEWVRLNSLYGTQRWISKDGLKHYSRPGAKPEDGWLPFVVYYREHFWLFDGHHRAITGIDRGELHLRAHVKRVWVGSDR